MQDDKILTARKKIADILRTRGPSLPVQIARETELTSLFAGALLSELAEEKIIKISNMKVGGSPLYFLNGQESLLEKFHPYLPGKEKEAFLLLRKKKILEDKKQHPAIRVALRNLRDFAFPFSQNNEICWRFHTATEQETTTKEKKSETKAKSKTEPKKQPVEKQENRLDIGLKKERKTRKSREKPDFVLQVIRALQNSNIELIEEKLTKQKEFSGIIRINSDLGKMNFLCVAKNKKRITENDLRLIVQKAQTLKVPALVLFPQEINKKALNYANTCPLLKLRKLTYNNKV